MKFEFATAGASIRWHCAACKSRAWPRQRLPTVKVNLSYDDRISCSDFEFDLGHILVAQAASNITDGSQFIVDGDTYEFYYGGPPPTAVTPILLDTTDDAVRWPPRYKSLWRSTATSWRSSETESICRRLPNIDDVQLLGDGLVQTGLPGVSGANRPINVTLSMKLRRSMRRRVCAGGRMRWQTRMAIRV